MSVAWARFALILASVALIFMLTNVAAKRFNLLFNTQRPKDQSARRKRTIYAAIIGVWKFLLIVVGTLVALNALGFRASSIAVIAGLGSLVFAFAAQSLLRDLFAGALILIENHYNDGDWVALRLTSNDEVQGFIDSVSLRRTTLRNLSNQITSVNNGEIASMTNSSKFPITIRLNIVVPKSSRLSRVRRVIQTTIKDTFPAKSWSKHFREAPSIYGMTQEDTHAVTLKVNAPLKYGVSWTNGYRLRQLILTALQQHRIATRVQFTELIGNTGGKFKELDASAKDSSE